MTCLGDSLLAALLLRPFSSQTAWAAMPSLNACLLSGSFESELNSLEKPIKLSRLRIWRKCLIVE